MNLGRSPDVAINATAPETPIAAYLRELHRRLADRQAGELATYIPELARADPSWFGIALATVDGHVYEVGDTKQGFTIQSVSKPFVFGMALDDHGVDQLLCRIGVEPTGEGFNAIVIDEVSKRPFNPMVNAGAIVTSGQVLGEDRSAQLARILNGLGRFAGHDLMVDEAVFASERSTGHRNRAIGHLLRAHEMLGDDVEAILRLYFSQCSVTVTCRDLAMMAATLANRGVNPLTGDHALQERHVANVLSVMSTCGMYDYAGEWIYRIGMPAKSGVSGGILAVLPGQFGVAVFSPLLDSRGNSERGIAVCEELSRAFGLHIFTPHSSVPSPIRRSYSGDTVRSKRFRGPAETVVLDARGESILVYELQGDVYFAAMELLTRTVAAQLTGVRSVVFDCKRLGTVNAGAIGLLGALAAMVMSTGRAVLFSSLDARPDARRALEDIRTGDTDAVAFFADLDAALQACEDCLISDEGESPGECALVALVNQELTSGLDGSQLRLLESVAQLKTFESGATIFAEGEDADALYFLGAGAVDLVLRTGDGGRERRLATVGPGVAFGEMAILDGCPRSTTARAEGTAVCHVVAFGELERLARDHPELALHLHRNLARSISQRLRSANTDIRTLDN